MNEIQTVSTGGNLPTLTMETASTAVAAQARAMIEARYIMAKHCPRDIDVSRQKLMNECKRPGFAETAIYNKPIGKGVQGPSIRFAEAAARCLRNIDTSVMTVYDDDEKRIVRAVACDLEENSSYSQDVTVTKTVERSSPAGYEVIGQRKNKKNQTVYIVKATDDDILNKQNALISKAIRTLILRLIPGDLVDEAMDACRKTQSAKNAEDPDAAKNRILDSFAEIGVLADQIKEYVGGDLANLTPKDLTTLRGIYAAIKDGETSWREVMDTRTPTGKNAKPDLSGETVKVAPTPPGADTLAVLSSSKPEAAVLAPEAAPAPAQTAPVAPEPTKAPDPVKATPAPAKATQPPKVAPTTPVDRDLAVFLQKVLEIVNLVGIAEDVLDKILAAFGVTDLKAVPANRRQDVLNEVNRVAEQIANA